MAKTRMGVRLAAGVLLSWSTAGFAGAANVTPAQLLGIQPKIPGAAYTTPASQDVETCKVELLAGAKSGSSAYVLKDARGQILRRFFDTDGDRHLDVWSYYQDGVEVYREIDTNRNEKPDQFRWLNANGMKLGIDRNEDGKIDAWVQISAEEASQEVLQAIISRDFARLQALFVSDSEMKSLGLSPTEMQRIAQAQANAAARFQTLCGKLSGVNANTHWVRMEGNLPQCEPAGEDGYTQDVIRYSRATVLYENAGKHDFLQLGDILQVGKAWRLVEAPSLGDEAAPQAQANPELQKLLDELRDLDTKGGAIAQGGPGANATVARYNLDRAEVIGRIMAKDNPSQMEQWIRQQAECLSAAAQNSGQSDKAAYQRLVQLEQEVVKKFPGSSLAAFVTFREMQAEYSGNGAAANAQQQWLDRLTKFVQMYPRSDDTADAMMQLGMVSEFVNKEVEAKNWYAQLAKEFPQHPLAAKAQGALNRLNLEGQPLELTGAQANGGAFNIKALSGKVVAVYFWASWDQQYIGDFARLKALADKYGSQGFQVVCVNLDNAPPQAGGIQGPGVQVLQPGGLDSPLATQYGIMTLPNLFLVGKDGKVASRTVQVGTLEEEVKKSLK
jgi:TolA-binding protein